MGEESEFRIAFAGDRNVAVDVLTYLVDSGHHPAALMVSDSERATHAKALRGLCSHLSTRNIFTGTEFRTESASETLAGLHLDLIVAVHFPYVVPAEALLLARMGWLNLHPAYLPHNRGWHTPSWTILDGAPAGATLHFMDEGIDTGDIVARSEIPAYPEDTANSLYRKLKQEEARLFKKAWPHIVDGTFERMPQESNEGTAHRRSDLFEPEVQRLDLDASQPVGKTLRQLRALTTSDRSEAAYFDSDGRRFRVQVTIFPDEPQSD